MKLSCLQENFYKGLSIVTRVIPSQTQLPVLSNVFIDAHKDTLLLWGTDLEIGMGINVLVKVEEEGKITVPAKLLLDFISNLPPEKIDLSGDDTTLNIKSKSYESTMVGIPAAEFPPISVKRKEGLVNFDSEDFKNSIKQVVFATTIDETRPALSGVMMEIREDRCRLVATDGYRLSSREMVISNKNKEKRVFIVPGKTLRELIPLIDRADKQSGVVELFMGDKENQVEIWVGQDVLVSRLIGGEFPAYEKIIPQSTTTTVVVDRDEFLRCVKAASIFARNSANIIRLSIDNKGMTVSANAPQVGQSQGFLEAKSQGEDNKIAFNSKFLVDFLANTNGKEIIFEMTGPLNPGVFKIKGDDSFFHLVMPVRIQE